MSRWLDADLDRYRRTVQHAIASTPAKGIGELGNVGMNAAVANAVFHATGIRVREIPIRLEKLLVSA